MSGPLSGPPAPRLGLADDLEAGIDWLGFQGEHAKDALVNAANRLPANKTLQGLYAEGEFAQGQRSFAPQTAGAQTV